MKVRIGRWTFSLRRESRDPRIVAYSIEAHTMDGALISRTTFGPLPHDRTTRSPFPSKQVSP